MNDELAWVLQAQQGNDEAFTKLVEEHQTHVYNLCYRMLGEPEAAEDAAQETFLTAYRKLTSFRGGNFKAWLARIATNACYDELRRQKRRPTTPLEPDTEDGDEMDSPRWLADPGMTPDQKAEADELRGMIQRHFDYTQSSRARAVLDA